MAAMRATLAAACLGLLGVTSCARASEHAQRLSPQQAEALVLTRWSTAVGVGDTNCTMRFEQPALTLQASGRSLTFHGTSAERCAKSLAADGIVSDSECHGDTCTAKREEKVASVHCDDPSPCRLALKCGTAKLEDLRVITEGRHATITFDVKNTVTTSRFDGCPDSPKISDDGAWTARASLDDAGRWALDGAPSRQ